MFMDPTDQALACLELPEVTWTSILIHPWAQDDLRRQITLFRNEKSTVAALQLPGNLCDNHPKQLISFQLAAHQLGHLIDYLEIFEAPLRLQVKSSIDKFLCRLLGEGLEVSDKLTRGLIKTWQVMIHSDQGDDLLFVHKWKPYPGPNVLCLGEGGMG